MENVLTSIVVVCVPTELVGTHQVCCKTSFGVAGFPTVLAVAGIPTRFVVAIFPTTSLVGRLPQQRLWDWHTIGNLAEGKGAAEFYHVLIYSSTRV